MTEIKHDRRFQDYCRSCPHFGRNFACPPNTPYFASYAGQSTSANVICLKIFLSKDNSETVEQQQDYVREVSKLLGDELRGYIRQGYKVAGSGYCRACPTCAAENGGSNCSKPDERIFSLEAMGVDVGTLLEASLGFGLEWNKGDDRARYLCVVGAVFREPGQNPIEPAKDQKK